MARRKSNKIQPAVLTLAFQLPSGAASSTIDLSQCASLVNRRFYRQGLNWAVAGFKLVDGAGASGSVTIGALPNTWVTSNAWEKGMRTWLRQQDEAIEDAGLESAVARFRDFKIHMDKTHVDAGFASNLIPVDYAAAAYAQGEWNNSLVVIPNDGGVAGNTQEFSLHMVGDDDPAPAQSKGLIKAYAESRSVPFSPDPVNVPGAEQSLFVEMFDKGMNQEEVVDNALDRNDNLPYPQLDYPGGDTQAPTIQSHDASFITATTIGGTTRLKGGNFPCGLIRLTTNIDQPTTVLLIDLVPGNHRGYLCESMTEM
jgi:hypothetical protein